MGFIMIGIDMAFVVARLFIRVAYKSLKHGEGICTALIAMVVALIFFAGLGAGICANTGGYGPWEETQTADLQNLADHVVSLKGDKSCYVNASSDGKSFSYYVEASLADGENGSRAYQPMTISSSGNTWIVEEPNCEEPRITTYQRKPVSTFWSFAAGGTEEKYVFYVPEGAIAHDFILDSN